MLNFKPRVPRQMVDITSLWDYVLSGLPQGVDAQMRLSLTYYQGREMAAHQNLTHITGMQVYIAHPYIPWDRGTNENSNCLLRQYLPKGENLDKIGWYFNNRPRKSLAWK